ncbi:hypothetical protein DLH87_25680 [Vibrio parahaemolyticus]|nr:hypothetical protein [Vibrio parahaemolyticus]EGR3169546.1 hypothetical protein [Vibrio parahaemolyticus]EGR3214019.1 hypothetical protein [Vibrio parahaemolyticus]EGR3472104.1 hypothetical protein [Vibrio parahaemolyticus]EGR3521708.1 hypothetical protein [Vibrio parahaemolyticus]
MKTETFSLLCQPSANALLSSEARYTNASALLRNHKTHCKSKMPRVPNLLEQFVMYQRRYQTFSGFWPNCQSI